MERGDHMAEAFMNHKRPPESRPLTDPDAYREHIAEIMARAYELAQRNKRVGDRYALAAILLAFGSSAVGFMTAALDAALVGIVAGILAAAGGAIAAWVRREKYDAIAAANRQLSRTLQRELRQFDGRAGPYASGPDEEASAAADRAFRTFVERCEQLSADAEANAMASGGDSP
jgi:hypothetical protein